MWLVRTRRCALRSAASVVPLMVVSACHDSIAPPAELLPNLSAVAVDSFDEPERYAADVSFLIEGAAVEGVGDGGALRTHTLSRVLRIERSMSTTGDRITTVHVAPVFQGIPHPSGTEDRIIGQLRINEATGETTLLSRDGLPVSTPRELDLAGLSRTGTSFGNWLRNSILTPRQLSESSRALHVSMGEPVRLGQSNVYRHTRDGREIELRASAETGLVEEETIRENGDLKLRTTYRYDRLAEGMHVRTESRTVRRDPAGRVTTYTVSVGNLTVTGNSRREVAP